MSDFAQGWIVWKAPRAALLAALAAERVPAFLARGLRPALVFPREARESVARVAARLPASTIVMFSAGDDWGEVSLFDGGRRVARLKTAGSLTTSAHLRTASELLEAARHRHRRRVLAPGLGDPVPSAILAAMGVSYDVVEYRWYEQLQKERFDAEPERANDFVYVNADGAEEPYALGVRPVSVPRTARTLRLGREASSASLLDEMRKLDPKEASPESLAWLEELAKLGPGSERSASRVQTVREAAASLLARGLECLPEPRRAREAERLGGELVATKDDATRALLALALRRIGGLARPMLEESLTKERDATAARRTYEALCDLRHDLTDAELLERARSASVLHRKGAYALLEQSASTQTLRELERCLATERDAAAHNVLAGVVERLRSELA